AKLERPRRLALELPLRREAGRELAVGAPARQVVEDVERDTDVVRRRAQVRVQVGDVAALGDDEVALRGGLRLSGMRQSRERGGRAGCRDLQQDRKSTRLNSSHVSISYAV